MKFGKPIDITHNAERNTKMKKITALLLVFAVAACIASCSKKDGEIKTGDSGKTENTTAAVTDKDGNALTLIDVIADNSDIAEEIDTKIKLEKLKVILSGCLDPRERAIIEMRYGLGGGLELTQRDIAKRLNISRSYVSRIEKSALEKLRRQF